MFFITDYKGSTTSPITGQMGAQEGEKHLYLEGSGVEDNAYLILHVIRDNTNKTGLFIYSLILSMCCL